MNGAVRAPGPGCVVYRRVDWVLPRFHGHIRGSPSRRCLIAADGFYVWKKVGNKKQPFYIRLRGDQPFAFAGLWGHWESEGGEPIGSCTIITCDSNQLVGTIHDRMPVILPPKVYSEWLDAGTKSVTLAGLLKPYPDTLMEIWPVGLGVNSPKNDSAELLKPLPTN